DVASNSVDYSAVTTQIIVDVSGALTGLTNIGDVTGNGSTSVAGATSILQGGTTWTISGADGGTVVGGGGTFTFHDFPNLKGTALADSFAITTGSVSGSIDGLGGANTLDYSGAASPLTVTLTGAGTSVGYKGSDNGVYVASFDDITVLKGTTMGGFT